MFESVCEKCESRIFLDNLATAESYNKETSIIIDEDGKPTIDFFPDYVVLQCPRCGTKIRKSFDEVIRSLKYDFLTALIKLRQLDSYENLDRSKLREESGVSYCGMCPGPFEGDGYCLNDLKDQCIVRRTALIKDYE